MPVTACCYHHIPHCMNKQMSECMSYHLEILIDLIFTLPWHKICVAVLSHGDPIWGPKSQFMSHQSDCVVPNQSTWSDPPPDHQLVVLSYNHSLACHAHIKVLHHTVAWCSPSNHPFLSIAWSVLLIHVQPNTFKLDLPLERPHSYLSTSMVLADPQNKTDTPLQLHDRRLD